MNPTVHKFADLEKMSLAAAEAFLKLAARSVAQTGHFTVALSGGQTPERLYQILSQEPYATSVPWSQIQFFWSDERCVELNHAGSNYRMALQALFNCVQVAPHQLSRIPTELKPPMNAALAYEKTLRLYFKNKNLLTPNEQGELLPRFNLILLGMGEDGHTASLFPNAQALQEKHRWTLALHAPPNVEPAWRISLTLPVINHAEEIFILVAGQNKKQVIESILKKQPGYEQYPAAYLQPQKQLTWFIQE